MTAVASGAEYTPIPAANTIGVTYVDRRPGHIDDTESLLKDIDEEMKQVRVNHRGAVCPAPAK